MNDKGGILVEVTKHLKPLETPKNTDVERLVLSIMLNYEDMLLIACDSLDSTDFYNPEYEIIYTAIKEMVIENKESINFLTVVEHLKAKGVLEEAGGGENIASINSEFASSASLLNYIKILKRYSFNRALILSAKQTIEHCYENKIEPDIIATFVINKLAELNIQKSETELTSVGDIVSCVVDEIKDEIKGKKPLSSYSTGFHKLDKIIGGLQNTDLIILGGRSGDGKTSLAVNIAQHVSKSHPVLYFIIEMRAKKVVKRMLASASELNFEEIKSVGYLNQDEYEALEKAEYDLKTSKLYYYDKGLLPLERLQSVAMRAKREHGIEFIVVDYLQQINVTTKNNATREQEVAKISRGLKALAMTLEVPVLGLVQINENDTGDAPALYSSRESKAIIHDADIVMYLYNRHTDKEMCAYNGDDTDEANRNIRELVIRKNRNGIANAHLLLHWKPSLTTFYSSSLDYVQPERKKNHE